MGLMGSGVAVVVPARDEAAWIVEVITTMPAWVDHILIVDDASSDDTGALAESVGDPRVRVLRHPTCRGVGGAIVTGYRAALELGSHVVAVMAGDAQMDPADLARVVTPVVAGDADYVKGDRLRHVDAPRMPPVRKVGTACLGMLTSWATGLRVRDSQCGYTAAAASALRRLALGSLWTGYGYPNDLLSALACADLRVVEVVVRPVYRGAASGLRPRHALVIAGLLGRAAWRRVSRHHDPRLTKRAIAAR